MYLFESSIDIDASAQQCLDTWNECFDAWIANVSFSDFATLLDLSNKQLLDGSALKWGLSARSSQEHKALWWRQKNSALGISGVVIFHAVQSAYSSPKTRVTFLVTYKNQLQGVSGFWRESSIGLAIGRILKQFKGLVASNITRTYKEAVSA